jgi:hypothetical protein
MSMRVLFAIALLAGAHVARANAPADYAYTFAVDTTGVASSAWRVELTPAVYAWVQDARLRDIEVFNAAGTPVPLARFTAEPASITHEQTAALPVLGLPVSTVRGNANDLRLVIDRDADGRLRRIDAGEQAAANTKPAVRDWLLDASAFDHAIDRIVLAWGTPTSGVVARFGVEASNDLQSWRSAGSGTVLVLEQDGARLERHDIELAGLRAKYLRLHRLDDGAELSGLTAQARALKRDATPARAWLEAGIVATPETTNAPPAGVTRYDYQLPSAMPIDAARIELANDNALAPLTLFERMPANPAPGWSERARITAFRLRSGDETLRNSDIELPGTSRLREFRIESRAPLAAPPRLKVGYRPDSFVFLAEGDGPYTLAAGSLRAQRADYPIDAALATLRAKLGKDWQPPLARLGTAKESGGAAALKPLPAPIAWERWLLWGVLIAAAALVGGFALSLLRSSGSGN